MSFAENLKYIRKKRNITQEELAELLSVSRQAVSRWESEIGYPETEKLLLLARELDVSLDYLFSNRCHMVRSESTKRVSKIDTYLNCAEVFAHRSTCIKRKYGAVIVKDDVVISTGYNGAPEVLRIAVISEPAQGWIKICIKVKGMESAGQSMRKKMRC